MFERCQSCQDLAFEIESLKQTIAEQQKTIHDLGRRNELLFEDGPLSYQSLDKDGRFVDVNRKWLQTTGYTRGEVIGKRFDEFLTPNSAETFRANFPKLKSAGKVSGVEFELMNKDGSRTMMNLMGIASYDHDNLFSRTHCLLQDMTRELASLNKFNSLFYQNPCPMSVASLPERIFVDANQAFLTTLGYSRDEVIGKTAEKLGLLADEASVAEVSNQLLTTGSFKNMELRFRSKSGKLMFGLVSGESINIEGKQHLLCAMLGITELKRLETELRKSEEKFRLIAETSPNWIWSIDPGAFYTYSNQSVSDVMGYLPEEVVGVNAIDLIHPDDRSRIWSLFLDCAQNRRSWKNVEFRCLHKNKSIVVIESSGAPIIAEDGTLEGFRGIDSDVTERNRVQETARKNADILRLIVEKIGIPIGLSKGVLQEADYLNPKWMELFGLTLDDMPSIENWWPLAYPDENYRNEVATEWNSRVEQAIRNKSEIEPMVTTVHCGDGSERIIEWHVISSGEWNVVHGVDLTEHKRLEKELRLSESKFRELTETAPDWIWEMDLDGKVLYSNPAVEQLTGYTAEELVGRMAPDFIHRDNLHLLKNLIHNCIVKRSGWHNEEGYWLHKDGSVRVFEAGGIPLMGENNKVIGFRGIARDISERKKLETERLRVHEQLMRTQKLESLAVMAGGIAHDFNNILMGVMGNLELIIDRKNGDPTISQYLRNAMLGAERAAELSSKMLVYSGCQVYLPKNFSVGKMLVEMKAELQELVSEATDLVFDVSDDLPMIKGEPNQMRRLITNLALNASEALGEMPGTVKVSVRSIECDDNLLNRSFLDEKPPPGSFVRITVSDTGCGIESENIHKLFDPFFTTKFWGRGLGMSEVLGVVKSHEGAILVDSVVGRGSTIQALFPVSKEQKKASEVTASTDIRAEDLIDTALKKKTILVVDDEDLVRSMLSERLNILGYHSIQAVDGEHGIELFKSHGKSIDLVLLDFMMPGMNGVEVFEELLNIDPTVKVILSTGYATEEVLAMFSGRNPDAVIHKPYKLQNLKNELDRILEQRT